MKSLLLSLVGCSILSPVIADYTPFFDPNQEAAAFYFLRFNLPAGGDQQFTGLIGEMVVPPYLPTHGGNYYIWPGLETEEDYSVNEHVLKNDGSGTWTYSSGYCCRYPDPEVPWTDNVNAQEGQTLLYGSLKDDTTWTLTQANLATGDSVSSTLDNLTEKEFKSAVFTIQLFGVEWDFGPMIWKSVVMTSTGSDASWCNDEPENWAGAAHYTISDLSSTVDESGVTCNIGSLVMDWPLAPGAPAKR